MLLFLIQQNLQINSGDSCSCVHHMYTAFIMSPAWMEFLQDYCDTQDSYSPFFCQDTECFAFPVTPLFSLPLSCRNLLWDQPTFWLLGTLYIFQRSSILLVCVLNYHFSFSTDIFDSTAPLQASLTLPYHSVFLHTLF